ncbi:hypothetical protein ATANTOWER_014067 [Ataeniobius toweri]|uniref:Uncharacterized protein n=1 Tax=Ataeniobius toweri TaxID=208326 RepID=A0ABU7CH06_9TELE|nr:hypothetical protein [Ataeniobius toweri]
MVKLSKIMSASKGGYKRRCMTEFFPVAAKHKSGDGPSTNGEEQNDRPAASTSTASVIYKDIISAVGGLNKQKKWRFGIDPAWKEAFQWLDITADEAGRPSHWVICSF